ncbi:hypothetical protein F5890DRAFT_1554841 [Lentinula detonsa]|uniref:Uncharacterized protein n=1 Tax=Lentinula detonsa TaxID=2804962 RepID=A0AA38USI4_9AGAR|nr:hypothetical protein F5890DRAFT_1554841 [Lentinula detonsa]
MFISIPLILALSVTTFAKPFPRQETSLLSSPVSLTSSALPASTAVPSGSARATPLPGDNTTFADCSQYLSGNQTSGAPPSSGNSTAGPQAKQAGATSVSVSPTTSSLNGASPSSIGDDSAAGSPPPANGTSIGTLSPTPTPTGEATVTRRARQETSLSTTVIALLSTVSPSATNTPATEKSLNATAQAIDGNNSTSASSGFAANNTTSMASSSVETAA